MLQCSASSPAFNLLEGYVDLIALLTLVQCECMYTAFTVQHADSRHLPLYCICDSSLTAGNAGHKPNLLCCCPLIEGSCKHVDLYLVVQVFSATAPSPMVRALQLRLLRLMILNSNGQQQHSLLAELQSVS